MTADETAQKDELRTRLLAARRARPSDDLVRARAAVCARARALVAERHATCVAAYEPLRTEPGSLELLTGLHSDGVRVLVPWTRPDRDLDWQVWTPSGPGPLLGVSAISAAELLLVPALAVAADGTRLGRGRGCYDRALVRRRSGAQIWALVFDDEVVDSLPAGPWDVPVDGAITPSGAVFVPRNTDDRSAG